MNKSLYNLLGMKRKNSIMKSVFITDKKNYEGLPIVEVEAYDQTFLNATNTIKKYDNTVGRIMKEIYKYFNGGEVWLIVYTDNFGQSEILVNEFYMKQFGLL